MRGVGNIGLCQGQVPSKASQSTRSNGKMPAQRQCKDQWVNPMGRVWAVQPYVHGCTPAVHVATAACQGLGLEQAAAIGATCHENAARLESCKPALQSQECDAFNLEALR